MPDDFFGHRKRGRNSLPLCGKVRRKNMGFEALLGNERLKDNLRRSLKNNRISHFYLISGPVGSGRKTLTRLLAAAILCRGNDQPCGVCSACRKVMEDNHPDFITIDDPEKKYVPVDLIRQARSDIYILPNESAHKIYLLPRAQDMRVEAQNALLKVLEEPPEYGVFLLLSDNPEKLLPTVRSRCVELKLTGLDSRTLERALKDAFPDASAEDIRAAAIRSGGFLGQAKALLESGGLATPQTGAFAEAFSQRDAAALLQVLIPMEKWKRDALEDMLNRWLGLLTEALSCRAGMPAANPLARRIGTMRSAADIMDAVQKLQTCIEYAQHNVSTAAICSYLSWELR